MKKILSVFGTRPEAIKMAPVLYEIEANTTLQNIVCVTAQHRQMLDQVLGLFKIIPDYDLDIMKSNQDLSDIVALIMQRLKLILSEVKPDIVLVHGDTSTSFAAALTSFYNNIPVGHVEAGLRTYDLKNPFPEEANRQITDRLSSYHFAPTETAKQNLRNEGIKNDFTLVTGNTVIDALFLAKTKIPISSISRKKLLGEKIFSITESNSDIILVTGHRRENFGKKFENICEALKKIAEKFPSIQIVYPVHLNPNVQSPVNKYLSNINNIHLIKPLDYLPFVFLLERSKLILTDSGGIQEEAPSFGKPVLVMRDTTERPEAVTSGTVKLVGTNPEKIIRHVDDLLLNESIYQSMAKAHNPYGDGQASKRITEFLSVI